jgi:hypothetical protein
MLQVKEESIPGSKQKVFSSNGHVAEGILIQVVYDLFNAAQAAQGALDGTLNGGIVSTSLLQFLGQVIEDELDEPDQSNNECSESNRSLMMEVSAFETIADFG